MLNIQQAARPLMMYICPNAGKFLSKNSW